MEDEIMNNSPSVKLIGALDLAKYLLALYKRNGERLEQRKLQKLIYYIDAWHNVFFDKPLIREDFEAWIHGPAVRSLWAEFTHYKSIDDHYTEIDVDYRIGVSRDQIELITDVLAEYGDKTSYHLENLTHEETPWKEARRGYAPADICRNIISKETMKSYYRQLLSDE